MAVLVDLDLYSVLTPVGLFWSILTYWLMFSRGGRAALANPWGIAVFGVALILSLGHVFAEMERLSALAGGMTPLDGQFGYGRAEVVEFAQRLGAQGRREYAMFQLGADTLAPPAFACFLMAVFRSTVPSLSLQKVLTLIVCVYFSSVLLANALMPVIMLSYPATDSGVIPFLMQAVPRLDFIKYASHGLAWLIVFGAWLWRFGAWGSRRFVVQAN